MMTRQLPRERHLEEDQDVETSEYKKIAFTLVVSLLSLTSILLIAIAGQTVPLWNWSLGLLFAFFFPGYALSSIFEQETQDEKLVWLLRRVGLSIFLTICVMFILGIFHVIQLLNVMISIVLLTFVATSIYFWKNRDELLFFLKNPRMWTGFMGLQRESRMTYSACFLALIFCLNVVFRTWLAVSNGIWRDGPFHAMVAQQIIRERTLVNFSPFNVVDITEVGRSYWPTAYPPVYHLLLAIMYMLGGEIGILFLSPLVTSFSVLGAYIITKRHFGTKIGVLTASFFSTDVVTAFVSASVYMDGLILFFAVLTIIEFENLLFSNRQFSPVLTGLWMGMLSSIKQTGILTAISMVMYGLVLAYLEFKSNKDTRKLKQVLKSIIIAIGIGFPFLVYQLMVFGSLLYPPFTLPFMNEIWTIDPESAAYLQRFQSEYKKPIYDILYETLLYPFPLTIWGVIASTVLGGLALLGLVYTIKNKRKVYLMEFLILSSFSLVFIVLFRLVIPRYFLFLRIFSAIYVIQGSFQLQEHLEIPKLTQRAKISLLTGSKRKKAMGYLFLAGICFSLMYQVIAEISVANESNRIGDRRIQGRIEAYLQAGQWVQQNTPPNVLILGGRAHEIAYYTQRDTLWIFWFGAHNVPKIFHARTAQEAITYLADYKIDYIWLDRLQVANGFYELIPLHGLTDIIGFSPFFENVFENNITRIFRVNYLPNHTNPFFAKTHYYGATLGGPLDFDKYQIIKLNDTRIWTKDLEGIGRKLRPGTRGFIEVQVDPNEFGLVNGKVSSVPISVTFYYRDTFDGTVQISMLSQDQTFSNLLEINGQNSGEIRKITATCPNAYINNVWSREIYEEKIISGSILYRVQNNQNSAFPIVGVLLIPGEISSLSIPDIP